MVCFAIGLICFHQNRSQYSVVPLRVLEVLLFLDVASRSLFWGKWRQVIAERLERMGNWEIFNYYRCKLERKISNVLAKLSNKLNRKGENVGYEYKKWSSFQKENRKVKIDERRFVAYFYASRYYFNPSYNLTGKSPNECINFNRIEHKEKKNCHWWHLCFLWVDIVSKLIW